MAERIEQDGHMIWVSATSIDGNPDGLYFWSLTLSFSRENGGFGFFSAAGLIFPREGATEGDVWDQLHRLVSQRCGGPSGTHAIIHQRLVPSRPLR